MTEPRPTRAAPSFGLPAAWWPVATGAEVSAKPKAFRLGERELCLYRDRHDTVRAVEDRCPHRRLPLSMGWVTAEGYLQCPYHGWCFDGASGQCAAIPNLHSDERVSPSIRVPAFATAEHLTMYDALLADGFVHVWSGTGAPETKVEADVAPGVSSPPAGSGFAGEAEVRAPYASVAEALLWNAGHALGLGAVLGSGEEVIAPQVSVRDGAVVVERERLTFDLPRVSTFDPLIRRTTRATTTTLLDTGLTRVAAEGSNGDVAVELVVALTPISTYRTAVRWRGELLTRRGRAIDRALRAVATGRRLAGRTARTLEHAADDVEQLVDPAIDRFRESRKGQ